ncbi:MAG: haloacid dehalogenase type II [Lentisphaerae bacterium]|nr:haloacid dehalogenase type II [Lentisphaerota bacterium]MCP4103263.1 haloacid dehalogenase type II [Lentisphaerota bacterium]
MKYTLGFDIYGTIVNTSGIFDSVQGVIDKKTDEFVNLWRSKQLEYSFRRTVMGTYADFSICTKQALDYCCIKFKANITSQQKKLLLADYKTLPAFPDAKAGIEKANRDGHRIFAFSNGSSKAISDLLIANDMIDLFDGVVSVEYTNMFKPSPVVYEYFLQQTGTSSDSAWLVSCNPFDIIGASTYGMCTAWVKRSADDIFDPWGIEPEVTISDLTELSKVLN